MSKTMTGRVLRTALLAAIPLSLVGCVAVPDYGYPVQGYPAYSSGYSSGAGYYAPAYVRPPSATIVIRPRPVVVVPAYPVRSLPHHRREYWDGHGHRHRRGHGDGGDGGNWRGRGG